MKSLLMRSTCMAAALLLCVTLTISQTGCGASTVQKFVSKANTVTQNIHSLDPAGMLLAEKLIDEAEAEIIRAKAKEFVGDFDTFSSELTALVKANPKASLAAVAPAFARALLRFNGLLTIKFKDPKAQIRYEQILSGVRLGLAFLSAFFDTKLNEAESFLRKPGLAPIERAKLALAGVPYDAARIARAREKLRAGGDDAGARAVCDYFSIAYDKEQVALIRSYASQHSKDSAGS